MTAREIFALLGKLYEDKPDDFRLSIGHMEMPAPNDPVSIYNMPEFHGRMSITMSEVREWAKGGEDA